jgi:hypothetical protein
MDVASRAGTAARIFDILGWVVLIIGGIAGIMNFAGFIVLATGSFETFSGETFWPALGLFVVGTILIVIYTALLWASITLATAVAGYISKRVDAPPAPTGTSGTV